MTFLKKRAPFIVFASLILLSLLVSVVLYAVHPTKQVRRTFFFPKTISGDVVSISRYIPSGANRQASIENYLHELSLGPHVFGFTSLLPANSQLQSLIYRDKAVYIDFSRETAFPTEGMAFENVISLVEKSIRFNFPFIDEVYITIDGTTPNSWSWLTE